MEKQYKIESFELCPFQNIEKDAQLRVLSWRNHELIRQQMKNSNPISEFEHFTFIEQLKNSDDCYLFVTKNGSEMGVVYFNFKGEYPELGLYLRPELLGCGKGVEILYIGIEFFFRNFTYEKIYSCIRRDNLDSTSLQRFFGFKEKNSEELYRKFELSRANWLAKNFTYTNLKKELIDFHKKNMEKENE